MKQRGFTLLEVIVAFSVVAVVAAALFEAGSVALRLHAKARNISQATLVVQSVMAELSAVGTDTPGAKSGMSAECAWHAESKRWAPPGTPISTAIQLVLYEVRVEASCGHGGGDPVVMTTIQVHPSTNP